MESGTPVGTPIGAPIGTDDGNEYIPPCRQAGLFIAPCPRCGRELRLKTLLYTHVCGRSFDPAQRTCEMHGAVIKAINSKRAPLEQPPERRVHHMADQTQQNTYKKNKYASLINF